MLIKYYIPTKLKTLNNDKLNVSSINGKFKNIPYPTGPLDVFDNLLPEDLLSLIEEQYKMIQEEANIHLKYSFLSESAYNLTLEQYNSLFYFNGLFYKKSEIKEYVTKQHNAYRTFLSTKPQQQQSAIPASYQQGKKTIKIDRQAIRNITGYSPYVIPKWSETGEEFYIEWQDKILQDQSEIIVVLGSRQIGKSWTMAESCIEDSFIPNNDMLIGAYIKKTTDVIRNYILKYIKKFPEGTFEHFKSEGYIINLQTGTKVYMRTLGDDAQNILGLTLKKVIVDEAQLVDEYVFNEVLEPTLLTTGGKMILIGTPGRKASGYYFDLIMSIKRGEKPEASLYEIDITKNPLVHPTKREKIMAQKDLPAIRRQYFCDFTDNDDQLFYIKKAEEFPILSKDGYFVLGIDPARKGDRSGYSLIYVFKGKATIIQSGFVPDAFKGNNQSAQYWKLQAVFFQRFIDNYKKYFKGDLATNLFKVLDSSGVGDGVSVIFNDNGVKLNNTIRYTAGNTQSQKGLDYTVSKSILINNMLDMISEGLLEVVDLTNKDLLEELSYIYEADTKKQVITFTSKFFDDITNATMIALYIVKEKRLINRSLGQKFVEQKSSGVPMVDALDKRITSNNRIKRNKSSTW